MMTIVETFLTAVDTALADADATLSTDLGGQKTLTSARLWRGQVLVDWEPDVQAGDCLLRSALLRRLIALQARVETTSDSLTLKVPGRIVAALSSEHAALVRRLGGARRVMMIVRLAFADDVYRGGSETFDLVEHGRQVSLLKLSAEVRVRSPHAGLPRTSPAPM